MEIETSQVVASSPVPIEYYVPFNTNVKSRYRVFGNHQELENFDYERYCSLVAEKMSKIDQSPASSAPPPELSFALSFEPIDPQFKEVKLMFTKFSQAKVDSVVTHLTKLLPEAIKRELQI